MSTKFLKSAGYSAKLRGKKVKCRIRHFLRGSVYGVVEMEVETSPDETVNTTTIQEALVEGATTYVVSEPNATNTVAFSSVEEIVQGEFIMHWIDRMSLGLERLKLIR